MKTQLISSEINDGIYVFLRYGQRHFMETANPRFVAGSQGALAWSQYITHIQNFIYLDFKEIN